MKVVRGYKKGIEKPGNERRYVVPETLTEAFNSYLGGGHVMGRSPENDLLIPVKTEVWDFDYKVGKIKSKSITLVYRFPLVGRDDDHLVQHVEKTIEEMVRGRDAEKNVIVDRAEENEIEVNVRQKVKETPRRELSTHLF